MRQKDITYSIILDKSETNTLLTLRIERLEMEKRQLEKDLELTQALLIRNSDVRM